MPTLHTQILTPVLDPNTSNAKPCTVNPYARAASQQLQCFLMPVQAPNASHTNPYIVQAPKNSSNSLHPCRCPTIHTQILMLVQVPDNSDNSLCLGSLLEILTMDYMTKINSV
ncbi:hypothetical protein O181_077798 [Austropuccinia psidii MF-1]|uniref:Uncharacterized protein n=1 Tax=Austropuccinia psidii MF-1 TaxID=1389203 RepID=A0A9Q3FDH0_9BASI|nr:hypothetical protein [Austropuccinia psidii MF-1]